MESARDLYQSACGLGAWATTTHDPRQPPPLLHQRRVWLLTGGHCPSECSLSGWGGWRPFPGSQRLFCSFFQSWLLPTPIRSPPPEPGLAGSCQGRPRPARQGGGARTCLTPPPSSKVPLGSGPVFWRETEAQGDSGCLPRPRGPAGVPRHTLKTVLQWGLLPNFFSTMTVVKGRLPGLEPWGRGEVAGLQKGELAGVPAGGLAGRETRAPLVLPPDAPSPHSSASPPHSGFSQQAAQQARRGPGAQRGCRAHTLPGHTEESHSGTQGWGGAKRCLSGRASTAPAALSQGARQGGVCIQNGGGQK